MVEGDDARFDDPEPSRVDFAALFPLDRPQTPDHASAAEPSWRLTPKTAHALHIALCVLADDAFDDVIARGDAAVVASDQMWQLFDRLPRITWRMDSTWRRDFARSADDLAGDLETGRWPEPRCYAEEMLLHLALTDAEAYVDELRDVAGLPSHRDDFDWNSCHEHFFQDSDILHLMDPALDGIDDPTSDANRYFGIGDMRPANWFTSFGNMQPREPRGYRR